MIRDIMAELKTMADPRQALVLQRFFKTGPGEYGEGDIFWGIKVPQQRKVARKFANASLADIKLLLQNQVHECRLTGAIILVIKFQDESRKYQLKNKKVLNERYKLGQEARRKEIVKFYLDNLSGINNWDLVDLSAPQILGEWLALGSSFKDQESSMKERILNKKNNLNINSNPFDEMKAKKMARSKSMWNRRVAMMSTFGLIKRGEFKLALHIADILLNDRCDLIQKAVGWMLREIGKRNITAEENFLHTRYKIMPRTALRYAIEKFPERKRQMYLKRDV